MKGKKLSCITTNKIFTANNESLFLKIIYYDLVLVADMVLRVKGRSLWRVMLHYHKMYQEEETSNHKKVQSDLLR
jgi:hypothetical protein